MKKHFFKYTLSLLCALLFAQAVLLAQVGNSNPKSDCPIGDNVPGHINPTPTLLNNAIPPPPEDPEFNPPPVNERRGIYWVHGLGGNEDSWTEAATATMIGAPQFPARNAFCFVSPKYATTSLEGSASSLHQKMLSAVMPGVDTSKHLNFIIAHSQGSLVSRQVDMYLNNLTPKYEGLERRFHGMVTFGGPHLGAAIINNRNGGMMTEFAQEACSKLLLTEAINFLDETPLVDFFVSTGKIKPQIDSLCKGAAEKLPFFMASLFEGTSNDYPVGGEKVAALNDFGHPELHKAAFAGVEYKLDAGDEPANPKQLMWRTVSSFLENRASNGPAFSGNEDDTLVNVANRLAQKYLTKVMELEFEIWTLEVENPFLPCEGIDWVLFPINCAALDGYYRKRVEKRNINRDAYNWLNSADTKWKTIIGAMEFQPDSTGSCQCISSDGDWSVVTHTNLPTTEGECLALNNDPAGNMDCIFVPLQVPVFKPSDGVVTLESASGFPGVAETFRVEETNHFQLRNSEGTRTALLRLYEGRAGNIWFRTE